MPEIQPQSAAAAPVTARSHTSIPSQSTTPTGPSSAPSDPPGATSPAAPLPHPASDIAHPTSLARPKSLALARLEKILADPDSSDTEARLAAAIVLRYAAASEPKPRKSSPTVREGSAPNHNRDNDLGDESEIANPDAEPTWLDKYEGEDINLFRNARPTDEDDDEEENCQPPPALILNNHHVQDLQQLAYDSGYWTGWHQSPFERKKPPYGPAVRAPGDDISPDDPLALVRPALTRRNEKGLSAASLHNAAGSHASLNGDTHARPPPDVPAA
jgi:hypothetical protein